MSPASAATQSCIPVNGSVCDETAPVAPSTPPLWPFEPAELVSPSTAPVFVEPDVLVDPDVFAEPEMLAEPDVLADPDVCAEPEVSAAPEVSAEPEAPTAPVPAVVPALDCFFCRPGANAFADMPALAVTPIASAPDAAACMR